jgi:hypothetical protein
MSSLEELYCNDNYLKSLPKSISSKFSTDWNHEMLGEHNLADFDTSDSESAEEREIDD